MHLILVSNNITSVFMHLKPKNKIQGDTLWSDSGSGLVLLLTQADLAQETQAEVQGHITAYKWEMPLF